MYKILNYGSRELLRPAKVCPCGSLWGWPTRTLSEAVKEKRWDLSCSLHLMILAMLESQTSHQVTLWAWNVAIVRVTSMCCRWQSLRGRELQALWSSGDSLLNLRCPTCSLEPCFVAIIFCYVIVRSILCLCTLYLILNVINCLMDLTILRSSVSQQSLCSFIYL